MASPGDSRIDCAPGMSKISSSMLRRMSELTRKPRWMSFHIASTITTIRATPYATMSAARLATVKPTSASPVIRSKKARDRTDGNFSLRAVS